MQNHHGIKTLKALHEDTALSDCRAFFYSLKNQIAMRAIYFPESNMTFNKPTSMDDSECLPLSVYVGEDKDGNPYINSVWMPSKEDLEAINAGRPIVLTILGTGMPPVSLFTYDENGNSNS